MLCALADSIITVLIVPACPPGYALNAGWCFGIQEVHFTQPEARRRCQAAGHWVELGDLADIRTAEENHFVYSLADT